jgi:uncharacterized membrane protein YgdD (TMEM256/DUF423 family)
MPAKNPWLIVTALSGCLAVAAGAYGAHGLSGDEVFKSAFQTGVQYHMWHSLALLGIAWFTESRPETNSGAAQAKWGHRAGFLFALGLVLFSGSLYVFGLTQSLPMSGLPPAGGMALMAGWLTLAFAATR